MVKTGTACVVAVWMLLPLMWSAVLAADVVVQRQAQGPIIDCPQIREDCKAELQNPECAPDSTETEDEKLRNIEKRCCAEARRFNDCFSVDCTDPLLAQALEDFCEQRCFPGDATVRLKNGKAIEMSELEVGDKVLTTAGVYSDVYAWSHRDPKPVSTFWVLETGSGSVMLTGGHYIVANGRVTVARAVKVGDKLQLANGSTEPVISVSRQRRSGLYNPHTLNGFIAVNDFVTSVYTDAVQPTLADALLSIIRLAYRLGHKDPLGRFLHAEAPAVAEWLPGGSTTY
mmetsp:Transcript_7628/g.23123  ORF Transcript_7628/g.23123 Transcript_7628/m.23123 type:complete len:286 (-) Transcript_7628:1657-2514(-)